MAYRKQEWKKLEGTNLFRFKKKNETPDSVDLEHSPNATNEPTPFSPERGRKLCQLI